LPRGLEGLDIAIVGTGIAGMSAAWLLSQAHRVTVYEKAPRLGGHSHTVSVPDRGRSLPVDMGFIVYNEPSYPNLTALFAHLGVPTKPSTMSFGVSLDDGALEYAGTDLFGLFAQRRNLVNPRFWAMLRDVLRFYRDAPAALAALSSDQSLGSFLAQHGYGNAFIDDHLLPMAAAIWSTPHDRIADYPAANFIRFCENHGLLRLARRPKWRTVVGGSQSYVARLTARYATNVDLGNGVRRIVREADGVRIWDGGGRDRRHDHVVIATHSDEALAMLGDPSAAENTILGALRYADNDAVMHSDPALMPRRRKVWASWNYLGGHDRSSLCVTYWMNRLQGVPEERPIFVSLNPHRQPDPAHIIHRERCAHPVFDAAAMRAQRLLWSLQGARRTWFCGAYFGAGFHEDGLQAGLAVAEQLGGVRRPWNVAAESGRICLAPGALPLAEAAA
jgi:hypothetical protein